MSVELFLRKRAARHAGEIALFCDAEVCAEEWASIGLDTEVRADVSSERNIQMLKYFWALAGIIASNTDWYLDKDDAMQGPFGLKMRAHHCKAVTNPETGEVTLRPLSLKRLSNEAFHRLLNRFIWVTCNEILPGIEEDSLRAEIENIIRDKRHPEGEAS